MKKNKCSLCNINKAKRKCHIQDAMICPSCCADIRNERNCSNCSYLKTAQNYAISKKKAPLPIIVEIDDEIEKIVDQSLALIEQGKINKGRETLEKLLRDNPKNHMINYGLGVSYLSEDKNEKAIHFLLEATKLFPYFVEAYFNLAMAYKSNLDLKNVVINFRKVVELGDPKEIFTQNAKLFISDLEKQILKSDGISLKNYFIAQDFFETAQAHMTEQKWEIAIQGFYNVLTVNPNHTQSFGNLGLCCGQLGQKEKAIKNFDKALELDPNYKPALINKKAILSLKDGESMSSIEMVTVDYYKNNHIEKRKSFIRSAITRIFGN